MDRIRDAIGEKYETCNSGRSELVYSHMVDLLIHMVLNYMII